MAGMKNKAIVAVLGGLTDSQALQVSKEIMRAKQKYAPEGRGTIAVGTHEHIGNLLQRGHKQSRGKLDY